MICSIWPVNLRCQAMSERKGISRYYPPDVDPSKVRFSQKQAKGKGNKPQSVRLMVPFSMKCLNCNEYIAQSRKFNARKQTTDRDYLGIKIIRFNIRCPRCYAELSFETDPKNGDYQCIDGCKKNYERPKEIKTNESIDEMIARLEKEVQQDERMKELERKGGNNLRNGLLGEQTGMEQLEKRLEEQEKERERVEELEDLQDKMKILEKRRTELDVNDDVGRSEKELDDVAKQAFEEYKKKRVVSTGKAVKENAEPVGLGLGLGLLGGYSDSESESGSNAESEADGSDSGVRRSASTSIQGVVKRRKVKIVT